MGLVVLDFLGGSRLSRLTRYGAPIAAHLLEQLEKQPHGVAPRRGAPTKLSQTGESHGEFCVKASRRVSGFPENEMKLETRFLASQKTR